MLSCHYQGQYKQYEHDAVGNGQDLHAHALSQCAQYGAESRIRQRAYSPVDSELYLVPAFFQLKRHGIEERLKRRIPCYEHYEYHRKGSRLFSQDEGNESQNDHKG